MSVEFISGKDHYDKVVARVASVRKSLWIGTADIKDLHVKADNSSEYNRENETCNFQKRNEQNFSFFASFFLLRFRPLKHQLNAD